MTTSENAKTQFVTVNEVKYAYRLLGPPTTSTPTPPLLLLQFFRASIDHWDPLLLSLLSAHRPLMLFDSAGVGHSTGTIPDSISGMAEHTSTFHEAIGVKEVDILGFSMGGMVAQQLAFDASTGKAKGLIIRKMILSATSPGRGPSGGEGVVDGDGKEINERAGTSETSLENFLKLFFLDSESSREAGREWYARIMKRTRESSGEERAREVQGMGIMMQGMSMGKWAGGEGSYPHLPSLTIPCLITNGVRDFMMPTPNSFVMSQRLPNAQLIVYPDSGHGHCFQFAELYVKHVVLFLDGK